MPPPAEGTWWCEPYASDAAVLTQRHLTVPQRLLKSLQMMNTAERRTRSALAEMGQWWSFAAEDEVHVRIVASSRKVPEWPHARNCRRKHGLERWADACAQCRGDVVNVVSPAAEQSWGDAELVPAFEPFVPVRPGQAARPVDNGVPVVLARLPYGQPPHAEWLAPLVRPELDRATAHEDPALWTPTALHLLAADTDPWPVLTDYWLDHDDPRGHFGALMHQGKREAAFDTWLTHHRSWLGPLQPFVPRAGMRFAVNPFTQLDLYVPPTEASQFDAADPRLLGVRELTFLPGSAVVVGPGMRAATTLGPLDERGFRQLFTTPGPWRVRSLELALPNLETLDQVRWSHLPHLQVLRLRLSQPPVDLASRSLPALECLELLPLVHRLGVQPDLIDVEWMDRWLSTEVPSRVAVLRVTPVDPDTRRATGWSLARRPGRRIEVSRTGLGRHASLALLVIWTWELRHRWSFDYRPGPHWDPTSAELTSLRA